MHILQSIIYAIFLRVKSNDTRVASNILVEANYFYILPSWGEITFLRSARKAR